MIRVLKEVERSGATVRGTVDVKDALLHSHETVEEVGRLSGCK